MKNRKMIYAIIFTFFYTVNTYKTISASDEIFSGFMKGYISLRSIKGSIVQYIYTGSSVEKFTGDYSATDGGLVRIDYTQPERQRVINNSNGLFWYYPDREILYVKYKSNDESPAVNPLPGTPLPISQTDINFHYTGIRFYGFLKYAHVYSLSDIKNGSSVSVWFEPERRYAIRRYVTDRAGRELVKEIYHEHYNYGDIYIPSSIELFARTVNGTIHTLTRYGNIIINSSIDKRIFDFTISKNISVYNFDEAR